MTAAAAPTGEVLCRLEGVAKVYDGTPAVTDVDLTVRAGETLTLVGPSGAGKTTLLRMMAGLVEPDRGRVELDGRPVGELRREDRLDRTVGMMQQALDLIPQLSVKHNVQAGLLGRWGLLRSLAALLLPVEHPGARAAVARVGLEDRLHERLGRLSGGEQQRVALARLLVQDPLLLLADEPISSLDPARSDDLIELLVGLADGGDRTVVTSLHEPQFARRHFDRIVGVRDGQVVFDRPPGEVSRARLRRLYELAGDRLPEGVLADEEEPAGDPGVAPGTDGSVPARP